MSDEELPPGSNTPHAAQSTAARPADWPEGVRPISADGLSHIGVGNDGSVYWDGKPVQGARRFDHVAEDRSSAHRTAALAAAGGTVASAIADWRPPHCLESSAT